MTTLTKIANELSQARHDQAYADLFETIRKYPKHEKVAVLHAAQQVVEAEGRGEIPPQTEFGRLHLANELTKAAAIAGNEEFRKEAANAFAAGQLAAILLQEAAAKAE